MWIMNLYFEIYGKSKIETKVYFEFEEGNTTFVLSLVGIFASNIEWSRAYFCRS